MPKFTVYASERVFYAITVEAEDAKRAEGNVQDQSYKEEDCTVVDRNDWFTDGVKNNE